MADTPQKKDVETDVPGVATDKQNAKLEHSEGGKTTRDDGTDVGVPMLQGDPSEPQGPEDALGPGPKRGDYRDRIGSTVHTQTQTVADKDGNEEVVVVHQNPNAENIGDESGEKGGVTTTA